MWQVKFSELSDERRKKARDYMEEHDPELVEFILNMKEQFPTEEIIYERKE